MNLNNHYADQNELIFEHYANSFWYELPNDSRSWDSKRAMTQEAGPESLANYNFRASFPQDLDVNFRSDNLRLEIERALLQISSRFPNKRPIIAYSGGIDSEVLLYVAKYLGLNPKAVFVNVWNVNLDERQQVYSFVKKNNIDFHELYLSQNEYFGNWIKQEEQISESVSPGAFSSYLLKSIDRNSFYVMYGSNMPQILWNKTRQRFYHITRETERVETQKMARHYCVDVVYPYQFGRVWYTIANSLKKIGSDFFRYQFASEIPGDDCFFMRGDVTEMVKLQKQVLYKNFPELKLRPKMTAHSNFWWYNNPRFFLHRRKKLFNLWTDQNFSEAPVAFRRRHDVALIEDPSFDPFIYEVRKLVELNV